MDFLLLYKCSLLEDYIWSKSLEYFLINVVRVRTSMKVIRGEKLLSSKKNIPYEDRFLLNNFIKRTKT